MGFAEKYFCVLLEAIYWVRKKAAQTRDFLLEIIVPLRAIAIHVRGTIDTT